MKFFAIATALLAALFLSGCNSKAENTPPQSYILGDSSLPSLSALADLGTEYQFTHDQDAESSKDAYVYTHLSNSGETVQTYAQALETEYSCRIGSSLTDAAFPDFSADHGQAVAVCDTDDSDSLFSLTIQWEEGSCTVIPSLIESASLNWQPESPVTLKEAVEYLENFSPSQLGLPGSDMQEYTLFAQEGTAFLDDVPCLCVNVYRKDDHQFIQSYLLTVPDFQVYQLDRETGEAYPLDQSPA